MNNNLTGFIQNKIGNTLS